ncbi:MAG: hypothetical protein NVS9B15_04820 [Acidobacteriaceae bacterium]
MLFSVTALWFFRSQWLQWLVRLGAPGLVGLGFLDNSVIPLPGSMDLLLIILAAQKHEFWPIYALAAVIGAVGGGYPTFRLGRKGGKEILEKKIPKRRLQRVYRWMEEHSFLTLFIPPLLPPPTPVSYFILGAGAMGVSRKKYFFVYGGARALRYGLLAFFAARHGHQIIGWARQNAHYMLYALLGLLVLGICAVIGWAVYRRRKGEPFMPRGEREIRAT